MTHPVPEYDGFGSPRPACGERSDCAAIRVRGGAAFETPAFADRGPSPQPSPPRSAGRGRSIPSLRRFNRSLSRSSRALDLYPRLGSSVVDHNATSARSRKVTVIWPVEPSILTWPKNCMPADGGRFCLSRPGALLNFTSGPNVLSSSFGPNVPACSGPETNSQNGSNSWNCALSGL